MVFRIKMINPETGKLEKKEFVMGFVPMMVTRKAFEIKEKIGNFENPSIEELDLIVDFIVEAFGNQFTRGDVYRGMDMKGFIPKINSIIDDIVSMLITTADEMGEQKAVAKT